MDDIRRSFLWLALAWGAAVALLIADVMVARAQTEAEEPRRATSSVEEIVVTAQKRAESIQDTPLSVSAITGEQLDQIGFANVNDIRTFVPNLNIRNNAGGNTGTTVSIRGAITGDPIITFEPAVGIYVDGVYISKSVGSLFDAPDMERVEVLRGPQGTLYGRNTIGGAINLIPRKPQDEPEARVRLGGGNFDTFNSIVTLDSGKYDIGDGEMLGRVGMRANLQYRVQDAMYDNRVINDLGFGDLGSSGFDDLNRWGGRIITRWEPRDFITMDYTFDYFRANELPTAFQLSGVRPGSPAAAFFPGIEDFVEPDRTTAIGNNRVMTEAPAPGEPAVGQLDLRNELIARLHNITVAVDFEDVPLLGDFQLKSISGWRSIDLVEVQDLDGTAYHITDFQLYVDQKQFSQELQIVGDAAEGMIQYAAGGYYFEERGGEDNPQVFFGGDPTGLAARTRTSMNGFDNWSLAPYGQFTIRPPILDERLAVTGGVRYTYEKKRASRTAGTAPDPAEQFTSQSKSFNNVAPMGNVSFDITDDVLGYYRFAQGYKSGGFNGRAPCQTAGPGVPESISCSGTQPARFDNPFEEEILTSHEFGFKTEWLDRRLMVNATGFFQDIKDKQVSDFRADPDFGAVTFVSNADQEMWGAEVEATAIPMDDLTIRFAYALLRPEYTRFNRQDPDTGEIVDVTDIAAFVNSPEHTVSLFAAYNYPTDYGVLTVSADGYWQDSEDYLIFDNDFISQGDYFIANGRIQFAGIDLFDGYLDLGIWGRNLFDKEYRVFGIDFGNLVGIAGNNYGKRRTFGMDVTWRWGMES